MDVVELKRLNKQVPIDKLLSFLHIVPNKSGFIHCPGHSDTRPSLKVYGKQGRLLEWKCFQCGAKGGSVEFLSLAYGISLDKAGTALKSKFVNPRQINLTLVERGDWWARVFRGWERPFCRKALAFIFQLPEHKRVHVYSAWVDYCLPELDRVEKEGDSLDLEVLSDRLLGYLSFVEESVCDLTANA